MFIEIKKSANLRLADFFYAVKPILLALLQKVADLCQENLLL